MEIKNSIKKFIPLLILFATLVLIGLFLASNKTLSSEFGVLMGTSKSANKSENVEIAKVKTMKVLFVGDMMFDRYIRQTAEKRGGDFVFAGTKKLLSENDLVVGNLEGPITENSSISVDSEIGAKDNYVFTFDSQTGKTLFNSNVHLVNIGNNHILNFGQAGLVSTKENLSRSGVDFFGDPAGEKRMAVFEKNGMKIAFVSYDQFEAGAVSKTLDDIKNAKIDGADEIILYTHWGKEFTLEPQDNIKNLAHQFVDAGADLVIGSHPHVIQTKEEYKGKTIYYSLGNFIFDQYFDPNTQKGLAVQVEISSDKKMQFRETFVKMQNNGQTVLQ